MLLSAGVIKKLELSDQQILRIRGMIGEHIESIKHLHARAGNAMRSAPPEKRRELATDLRQKVQAETAKRVRALNGRVLGLMAGPQRDAAMRLLTAP